MSFSKSCLGEMIGPANACTSKHVTMMTTLVVFIMNIMSFADTNTTQSRSDFFLME